MPLPNLFLNSPFFFSAATSQVYAGIVSYLNPCNSRNQGLENNSSRAKSGSSPFFVNKAASGHSHVHLLLYRLHAIGLLTETIQPAKLKAFIIWSFTEKLSPCFLSYLPPTHSSNCNQSDLSKIDPQIHKVKETPIKMQKVFLRDLSLKSVWKRKCLKIAKKFLKNKTTKGTLP